MTQNYYHFSRSEWTAFGNHEISPLKPKELEAIKSLNDHLSIDDVQDVYLPLIRLLEIYIENYRSLHFKRALFLNRTTRRTPFMIGIAGSVAVGKSTTARLLKRLLEWRMPNADIQLITTDGFLYSKKELERLGLMKRKGFPESYDMKALLNFFNEVKNGHKVKVPLYSHKTYDIIEDNYEIVDNPDLLIVEGINVLQNQMNQRIYMSDFFDFSIYVDADAKLIKEWYLTRFEALLDLAKDDPTNHYYHYAQGSRRSALALAEETWQSINQPNLDEFILPTKDRADLILHKTHHHIIDELLLKRY